MQNLGGFPERFASLLEFFSSRPESALSQALLVFYDFLLLLTSSQDKLATGLDGIEVVEDILVCLTDTLVSKERFCLAHLVCSDFVNPA